jgi:hypothetical protein
MKGKPFFSKYGTTGNSFTSAQPRFKPPAKIGGGTAANDGSTGQAEQQISAAPLPFQNPRGAANLPAPVNRSRLVHNPQGSSAGGTRPRASAAAAPRSAPPSHSAQMIATGHKPDYRAGYAPSTHPRAKARVWRGEIPGARRVVNYDDVFSPQGIADWNKNSRGL